MPQDVKADEVKSSLATSIYAFLRQYSSGEKVYYFRLLFTSFILKINRCSQHSYKDSCTHPVPRSCLKYCKVFVEKYCNQSLVFNLKNQYTDHFTSISSHTHSHTHTLGVGDKSLKNTSLCSHVQTSFTNRRDSTNLSGFLFFFCPHRLFD